MIKGAIFDVDGTLLDSMAIWEDVGARYLEKMGIKPEADLGEILFPMTVEEGAAYVKEHYGVKEDVPEIVAGVLAVVRDFYFYEAPLKAGAAEFLRGMEEKGIPMAAATSGEKEQVLAAFRRLHIDGYFGRIVTCSEVGAGKSSPKIYEEAEKSLGTDRQETYVFEDVIHAIRTARAAGFKTVGVYDSSSEKDQREIQELADIYLPELTDFNGFWKKVSAE